MMSIILHHYKILKEEPSSFVGVDDYLDDHDNHIYDNNNIDSTILKQELDKWYNFSFVLRKKNRILFEEMLESSYKYSGAIEAKGEIYSIQYLLMSMMLEHHKILNKY
jgi:hypothetical protein